MALRPQSPQSQSDKLAQREAAQQDVFLREVDEAVRQDEMVGLFKRWGVPLAVLIVAGLLALAGYLYWDHDSKQRRAKWVSSSPWRSTSWTRTISPPPTRNSSA